MNQTVEVKTSELIGPALDWVVALSEGATNLHFDTVSCWWFTLNGRDRVLSSGWSEKQNYCPSTDWRYGGPLIEREKIAIDYDHDTWNAAKYGLHWYVSGPTPLVAAMRCLVASKLGDTVQVPAELI